MFDFLRALKWFGKAVLLLVLIGAINLLTLVVQLGQSRTTYVTSQAAPGLTHSVEILRDENNVPHIFSEDELAVYYGLGQAHATDRPWQMEMSRRIVQGRMAEILGKPGVVTDRFLRTLGLYQVTQSSYANLSVRARQILDAYAQGVNSVFCRKGRYLSSEFLLLGHTPELWSPVDSLAVLRLMSIGLSSNMQNELRRVSLLTELTPDELSQFWPNYPGDEPLKMPPLSDLYPTMDRSKSLANLDLPDFGSIEASNNWVVDGSRTKSGKPLLANDPHLAFSAPSIWYLAHLALPQGNVVGGTLPGFPTIVIGRTDQIAWGFTNTGTDVQDLYLEKINPDNANEYLTPEGWQSFKTRTETIKVRFAKDVEITVQETRHGPVLPPNPEDEIGFPPPGHVLSMAWIGLSEKDRGLDAFLDAASATSFKAFIDALEPIAAPMQNVVYADMSGTIGYLAPGMVPLRGKEHQTKGLIPAPGWREINDWQGIIPYDELPRITNPDSGIIATANHKITPPGYPHHLTFDWGMPYRADRIYQLLDQSNSHDAESFADIQIDNTSQFAQQILPLLLTIETDHGLGQAAYSLLADWDGHLQADRPEGLIFSAWVLELSQQIFSDDIGDLSEQIRRGHPHFLIQILQDPSSNAKWCDNLATEESQETCQHVLKTSFESALEHLAKTYGADIQSWRWGKAHKIVHRHRPFDLIPLVRGFYNVEVESGGGPYTPNQGNYYGRGKSPFTNRHGAGYRAIYDFDDLDNSLYIQTTGQSGNVLSPHYDDFAPLWQQGKLIKIPTQRSEVEKSLMIQTKLLPQVP